MLLPFYLNREIKSTGKELLLAGDIGATKTNLAIFKHEGNEFKALHEATYRTSDYNTITELTDNFIKGKPNPDTICFAVAGPVINGTAKLSNISWNIDQTDLQSHYNVNVKIINDLEATAYGLAVLTAKDIRTIHKVPHPVPGNAVVIAPGTGLGEAGIFWDGQFYKPFATEGGHCDFAARNAFDFELYTFLQKKFGHVSWERVASGQGIVNIYNFLSTEKKLHEPKWLKAKFSTGPDSAVIAKNIAKSAICRETMNIFCRYLAYECANLALKNNATGGLFIGGGIVPQNLHLFEESSFFSSFCQSGRLNVLLEKVPINIILNPKAALLGAAWFAGTN
ncbi:MAG TPA: glucokinase [Daejeonella sp.]|uniref:glucokinase n=1 Tax=Daejeonella sp. TaxID=2805397 RepID=UPI002ED86E33